MKELACKLISVLNQAGFAAADQDRAKVSQYVMAALESSGSAEEDETTMKAVKHGLACLMHLVRDDSFRYGIYI